MGPKKVTDCIHPADARGALFDQHHTLTHNSRNFRPPYPNFQSTLTLLSFSNKKPMILVRLYHTLTLNTFYEAWLGILTVVCLLLLLAERYVSKKEKSLQVKESADDRIESQRSPGIPGALKALAKKYLVVYAIVMGADWLQGPYVYSLYRQQYDFPERLVALLFVTGFLSAGMAAPLVGVWADQHGRRKLCLAFCVTYTLACILILVPSLPILLVGRLLGGVSTSILFSAFESWLISSASSSGLSSGDLSTIMGRATLVNGFVAAAAGVFSNKLVETTGNFASPFVASGLLLVLGFFVISASWIENYGGGGGSATTDLWQVKRMGQAWRIVRDDPMLFILGLTQTCFEGSMYLFVFIWVPSLQEVTRYGSVLPFGYIFSSFMVSMMSGSLLYTMIVTYSKIKDVESSLTTHAKLSSIVCAVSALSLACSISTRSEEVRFWAFCAFEACVGMYYPVQGMLRGTLISNEHRATLSSLFRVPLNVFVVFSLLTGVSSARQAVLTGSAIMLAFSSLMTGAVIVDQSDAVAQGAVGNGHRLGP
ncbi:hypothetical protein D9756_006751 [Leucocoprinus leucothites]|uniref:Molybdate-anion transporter n=1 Tax=Leucocoprinus leucothites TaxID=201217 RepID=A0A8H5G2E9_9AGAR|nr:hypothetical protein D9756_006751 [Leucoagaricus leucothites]